MHTTASENLMRLGIQLPDARPASQVYVKTRRAGDLLYVAGHSPKRDGVYPYTGRLGAEVTLEQGQESARICILNALASIQHALGTLDRVSGVIKLVGYVASTPDFYDQPKVINPASELLGEVFGQAGQHARSSVGVAVLPGNIPVEIEMIVEIKAGKA